MRISIGLAEVSPKFQLPEKTWKAVKEQMFLQMAFQFEVIVENL